jgi:predicted ATPase/DNA-binding CsgD family transcriptional regulator
MTSEPSKLFRAQRGPPVRLAGRDLVTHVPAPVSSLVGREREVAAVGELIRDGKRLVTLTGPGGVGKTRLALRIAADSAPEFVDGVAFVDLSAIREPAHVVPEIARTLGVRRADNQPILSILIDALSPRNLLLVLDNFEQVVEAAPAASELLRACPRLTALVTSRTVLRLSGEWVMPVPPMALPVVADDGRLPPLAELREVETVRLYFERSRAVQPFFAVTDQNVRAIIEICARLDGLPLAIELAAARGALFPPNELLSRLERRLPLLTDGARDLPGRQRTMRDTVSWSYDLLTPEEQSVFRRLAVFAGGFTIEAAEAVCIGAHDTEPFSAARFATIVESLTRHSLIQLSASPADSAGHSTPRLTILETVREFAVETLRTDGTDDAERRHAAYFLALAIRTEQTFWGDAPGDVRATFHAEIANVRAALTWATERGDADTALQLASAMFDPYWVFDPLWRTRDHVRDLRAWIQRALALPGGSARNRIATLICAASLAEAHGDVTEARSLVDEAIDLARVQGDELGLATASLLRGRTCFRAGDLAGARQWLTSALDGFRARKAQGRAAWALCFLASILSRDAVDEGGDAAELARAAGLCEEALAAFLAVDYLPGIIRARHVLAQVAYKVRDLPRALALTQELLERDWADQRSVNNYLDDIADIAGRVGQPEIAARLYGAADKERTRHGEPVTPVFRVEYERDRALARRALGETAFAAAWAHGHAMPMAQTVAEALALSVPEADPLAVSLTPREREILPLLANGKTAREVGAVLFLSHRTVEHHIANLCAKFGVRTRSEVIEAARAAGLLPILPGT